MIRLIRSFTPAVRVSLIVGLLLLTIVSAPHLLLAAPAAGTFVVNTASDAYSPDSVLSLREALAVANGTLTGTFTANEQILLGGCTFDGGGYITGGCGAGIADTISFDAGLGFRPTITLTAVLPAINDTASTTINGFSPNNVRPILDLAFIGAGNDGLTADVRTH